MKLTLTRDVRAPEFTLGELSDESGHLCYTVEDTVRDGPKVPGKTAIPAGRYRIIITQSNRFKRPLPLLLNVPGFEGVRIHSGNRAEDTEGRLIVGQARNPDGVGASKLAFNELYRQIAEAIDAGEEVWLEIAP